jgi:DNA-binding IclR family transcriptional regulator
VVVASMESSEEIGFSVRVGHRRDMTGTVSGCVLYAFQAEQMRKRWERWLNAQLQADGREEFERRALRAKKNGYAIAKSSFSPGITDISAPIWRGESAAAALAIPFFESTRMLRTMSEVIALLKACAADISGSLIASDATGC